MFTAEIMEHSESDDSSETRQKYYELLIHLRSAFELTNQLNLSDERRASLRSEILRVTVCVMTMYYVSTGNHWDVD